MTFFPNHYYQDVINIATAKEIDSKTDLIQEESIPSEHRSYLPLPSNTNSAIANGGHSDGGTSGGNDLWPQGRSDMPQIKSLNVKCEKNHMKVNLEFDRPFYGAVFSKGHFNDVKCVHLTPGSGHVTANFDIFLGACGMTSSESNSPASTIGNGLYIENTIIIQYDAQVQEIWDQARRLRCTWYDYYEKAVTFKTFSVEMQDAVTANFLGDNIQCWMQIQTGKGPWASEVAGIVKIGQTMTMVLAIKDDENKFDMLVRNCIAHDGKHQPIQLVDDSGCVIRPKIMSKFHKVKNFGQSATVVSYAYFQAFKFPDSMNVHFQCVIQVCRHECPEPVCDGNNNKDEGYIPPVSSAESRLVSVGHRLATGASQQVPVYRPTPVTNYAGGKQFHHRNGDFEDFVEKFNDTFNSRQGNPRSLKSFRVTSTNNNKNNSSNSSRKQKRSVSTSDEEIVNDDQQQESTTVQTNEKIIQVVAPGDVAFSIASIDADDSSITSNGTIESIFANRIMEENNICMSSANLLIAIVIFSILLIVSSLMAGFLYYKLRQLTKMSYVCKDTSSSINKTIKSYESPEFYSSLTYTGLPRAHTKK